MTGFGKAERLNDTRKMTVEIRTLNSRQADYTIKIPGAWKDRELEIRNEILGSLQRGKIELLITVEETADELMPQMNQTAIKSYYNQLADISAQYNIPMPPDILNSIIRLPDILSLERQSPDENEWQVLLECIREALRMANDFREQEGQALMKDMLKRIKLIEAYLIDVEKIEPQRIEYIKSRLQQNLVEFVGENNVDKNRFEQELIYYLDKISITEEKVRLRNHCSYFISTMDEGDGTGKKLGFIVQEIGREINTIGSKANNAEMQIIVIKMKDELEKIREQLQNIL